MTPSSTTTYDDLPYEDHVFGFAQPAGLATVAYLHGFDPPPLDRCRVLDIGCAAGSNLLPMAIARPGAELVGVDLSPRQIAAGRETVAQLGLDNLALHVRDLLEPTDDLGSFDYIICHGVYSWVPPAVQDRILNLIRRQLSPNGLAYVSYNTYPGWHLRGMVRDMMSYYATGSDAEPAEQVEDARSFLDLLVEAMPGREAAYEKIMRREVDRLRPLAPSYVYHEFLETDNRPVYFHQFAAHAAAHELQYIAEASPLPLPGTPKPGVLDRLAALAGDRIRMEQYLDFVRCRTFRRSLLCHADARPHDGKAVDRVPGLAISSRARPESSAPDPDPATKEKFVVSKDVQFATSVPLLRTALWRLWDAQPAALPFADLCAVVDATSDARAAELADCLLQLYLADMISLHLHPPALARSPGPRPTASPFARLQAERGDPAIYNLCHSTVDPDPFARYLLPLLDGTCTPAELVEILADRAAADEFAVHDNAGEPVTDPAVMRTVLTGWIETALDRLAKSALLMP